MYNAYKRIEMEDRGCTPVLLKQLYEHDRKTIAEIKEKFGIVDGRVLNRWFEEAGIEKRKESGKYTFNKNYFDVIDTEEKAYWLGFIWCDGYVLKRERRGQISYEFKLDLEVGDKEHIQKFKDALESTHPIREYTYKSNFDENKEAKVARLYICNKYFGSHLHNNLGLKANRFDINKLTHELQDHLVKHFIRGVIDADGYIGKYIINATRGNKTAKEEKNLVAFYTYEQILEFVQNHLIDNGLQQGKLKTSKRHEGRDGHCQDLKYCGRKQVPKIIKYLYGDANIYLERKFKIAKEIINSAIERGVNLDEV